ncbi:MAG: hypothetical protein BWZ10_00794 [candidate division BRC1 bacterium ADurb.BinA364]|nr:MAG: hypothetical protein BWZ10_00794 [candidate division BRC1 bacterium ADurb.BinA364]
MRKRLLAIGLIWIGACGCTRAPEPFPRAASPLDPARYVHARGPAPSRQQFASFVSHAAASADWILLDWRGEALYVRCNPQNREISFLGKTNKIASLKASGGVEALSLRRYARADSLEYIRERSHLGLSGNVEVVENPDWP